MYQQPTKLPLLQTTNCKLQTANTLIWIYKERDSIGLFE